MSKDLSQLCGIITNELGCQVTKGDVFINRFRTYLKLLVYEQGDFTIFYRRLEQETFEVPVIDRKNTTWYIFSDGHLMNTFMQKPWKENIPPGLAFAQQ